MSTLARPPAASRHDSRIIKTGITVLSSVKPEIADDITSNRLKLAISACFRSYNRDNPTVGAHNQTAVFGCRTCMQPRATEFQLRILSPNAYIYVRDSTPLTCNHINLTSPDKPSSLRLACVLISSDDSSDNAKAALYMVDELAKRLCKHLAPDAEPSSS